MWATITQFIVAAVSVASLGFAVITQVRQFSQRKYAERAETAMRLLSSLQEIEVGGISPKLDGSLALKIHHEQVHGLQEVIRVNVAEFEARAKRRGFPLTLHFLIGIYGILAIVIAFGIAGGVGRIQADQRWVGVLIVVAIMILGVVMILDCVTVVARRLNAREIRRRAGIYVPSALEVVSVFYASFILWRRHRRDGRRRGRSKDLS
jgi:uncharacterized membrane protein YhaH (DUF805 family)